MYKEVHSKDGTSYIWLNMNLDKWEVVWQNEKVVLTETRQQSRDVIRAIKKDPDLVHFYRVHES